MPATNIAELSVSELAFALKRTVEDAYGLVRVRGELTGFKKATSGHLYFSLKDDRAVLDAVSWRGTLGKLAFQPEDGLEVICTGKLTTYPGRSRYQLVVEQLEPAGAGALMALLEERRRKLTAEGLFDAERKRPLPFLPDTIAVVTSATGAVLRDILHRLEERFPRHVLLWPVPVQGEGAAEQIAAAIRGFSALPSGGNVPRPDVLIVARGGGSIEDLWSFNEEVVIRAAAACTIPLISAVGHETDTTLIDLVSDRRAPTPSAAAEMAVPVRRDLILQVQGLSERLEHGQDRHLARLRERVEGLARGLVRPETLLNMASQRLDDLAERLRLRSPSFLLQGWTERLEARSRRLAELMRDAQRRPAQDLARLGRRLVPALVSARIEQLQPRLEREGAAMRQGMSARLERLEGSLQAAGRQLESLSHTRVLERGYAIVRARGQVVSSLQALGTEQELELTFADGTLPVRRLEPAPKRRQRPAPVQGELL